MGAGGLQHVPEGVCALFGIAGTDSPENGAPPPPLSSGTEEGVGGGGGGVAGGMQPIQRPTDAPPPPPPNGPLRPEHKGQLLTAAPGCTVLPTQVNGLCLRFSDSVHV